MDTAIMSNTQYKPRDYKSEFEKGELTLSDLYAEGFRCSSNRYRLINKKWKAYKRAYEVSIQLSEEQYKEFKEKSHCKEKSKAITSFPSL